MYKSFKIIDYHPMSPSPKPFGTYPEPEKQKTINKDYESIRRLIKSMDKILRITKIIIYKYYIYGRDYHSVFRGLFN